MSERGTPKPLDDLEARISRVRQSEQKLYDKAGEPTKAPNSALGQALRIGVEMASAVGVGFFIGWLLDTWLNTSPWLKIVFLLMGAAAGVLNVYRLASGFGYAAGYRQTETPDMTKTPPSKTTDPAANEGKGEN